MSSGARPSNTYWNGNSPRIRKVKAAELRRDYVHSHGLALHALSITGAALNRVGPQTLEGKLKPLVKVDWSRTNTELWEGCALIAGRASKAQNNVLLTAAVLKRALNRPLSPEEHRVETSFGKRGKKS